jgi:hypothetical protein
MKIIKVEWCRDCPYLFWREDLHKNICLKRSSSDGVMEINIFDKFPSWCPLEDYKGNQK